jgi:hypothetical protein
MRHALSMSGESTGGNSAADMAIAVNLAKICGFKTLFWAFDNELYSGNSAIASITDYSGYTTGI